MSRWLLKVGFWIGSLAVLIAALLFCLAFWGAGKARFPDWMQHYRTVRDNPKRAYGYDYENIQFPAEDGETLRGWLVPGRSGATEGVVTVHGAGGNREEFIPELKMLHESGYPVLMFDCREHGESDGRGRGISLGGREHRDVISAVSYAKRRCGLSKVVVFGCSQGAASAILAAAEDNEIDGVIAEASFVEPGELITFSIARLQPEIPSSYAWAISKLTLWRMGIYREPGPEDQVGRISPRPVLLMQGSADIMIPPHDVKLLYKQAREPKQIWIGEGAGHCGLRERYPEEYRDHIMGFLKTYFPLAS